MRTIFSILAVLISLFCYSTSVTIDGDFYIIDNGTIAVKVPANNPDTGIPAPIQAIKYDGNWYGKGWWSTSLELTTFSATVLSDGVRLRYDFSDDCRLTGAFAEITVRADSGLNECYVEETYRMLSGDKYVFEASEGWTPTNAGIKNLNYWANFATATPSPTSVSSVNLSPRSRYSKTLTPYRLFYHVPRWTQGAEAVYYSQAQNGSLAVGIAVSRAGSWYFPHDSYIYARTSPGGGDLYYDFPTQRGGRFYLLFAGDPSLRNDANTMVNRYKRYSGGPSFYDNTWANPTGGPIRGKGKTLYNDIKDGKLPACNPAEILNFIHPDFWGYPFNMWSPINPNFYTDLVRVAALRACGCQGHEQFDEIKSKVEEVLRMHWEAGWATPGGAGECPGYNLHSLYGLDNDGIVNWAPLVKQYLGIDMTQWEPYKEALKFEEEVGRTPQGDTHPPNQSKGNLSETKEYPHYGVVFVGAGTLNWKSGPMRGHYHGDQLSFHWWGEAIDHQVSY
jgi:hypothetical protein